VTPGFEQMRLAYEAARDYHRQATGDEDLFRHCGATAGFGGPMRHILVSMLDEIRINEALRIRSTSALFDPQCNAIMTKTNTNSFLSRPASFSRTRYGRSQRQP
jgi:hypothetical protein